ncbi:hypothetical protein SCANM124S_08942 [Streptomyces canus]|jgi:hypothetical protein
MTEQAIDVVSTTHARAGSGTIGRQAKRRTCLRAAQLCVVYRW